LGGAEFGKRAVIHLFIFPPHFFARWPISMPGDGMCMWPRFSLYRAITVGAGLGFIGRRSMRCLFTNGGVRPKSEDKMLFQRKTCYRTVEERIRLQE
jgi:hypothetical protein